VSKQSLCAICGQPMPPGEEMFKYHGYSGPCPAAPKIPTSPRTDMDAANTDLVMLTNQCEALNNDLTAQRAENARLREALRPFVVEGIENACDECGGIPEECPEGCAVRVARDALGGEA
jgi:hypothetical protein